MEQLKNPMIWHALAALSVVGGLIRVFTMDGAIVETKTLIMNQYLLWAILFEIVAHNVKS